jgi:hypothetical protein
MNTAVISDCNRYRYELHRDVPLLWKTAPLMFIGVNPSTADADTDDATIRKMRGFAVRLGYSEFMVGNVFAYRATDVRELATVERHAVVGFDNPRHLANMIDRAGMIIPCWGDTGKVPKSLREQFNVMRTTLLLSGKPVRIFGLTNGGDPLHPLMLSYETQLKEWSEL